MQILMKEIERERKKTISFIILCRDLCPQLSKVLKCCPARPPVLPTSLYTFSQIVPYILKELLEPCLFRPRGKTGLHKLPL